MPGGSPVAAWPQESARQPPRRSTYEPPSDAMWPNVPAAGRLPARHRDYGGSGTGLRLAAPTSASADHAACGSSVDGGTIPPRHESRTKISVSTILAATGPEADFAACHYPFSRRAPRIADGVVTGVSPARARGDYVWIDPDEPAAPGRLVAVRDPGRGGETVVRLLIERDGRRILRALEERCPQAHRRRR